MNALAFFRMALFSLLFMTLPAMAGPPHDPDLVSAGNLWQVEAYLDASPNHLTLGQAKICFFLTGFVGTHQRYDWVAINYPAWNGRATQEGDQVFMHGDFPFVVGDVKYEGHDASEWQVISGGKKAVGGGHWQFWAELGKLGTNLAFTNVAFSRIGSCQFDSAQAAMDYADALPLPVDASGNVQALPFGIDTSPTSVK